MTWFPSADRKRASVAGIFCMPHSFFFLIGLNARPAQAQQDRFAFCKTFDRTSSYYVAGEPVYFTDLFPVTPSSPDYKTAFQDFLKQKYGWTKKTVSCAIGFTKEGAEKSYNESLKAAGDKAVRTGWTLADMPASAPPRNPHQ